jgi:F-type H+-transporting ATPase subunit delta
MSDYVTVARPYAKAAFDFAKEHNAVGDWLSMISFLKEVVSNDDVMNLIESSSSNESVIKILTSLTDGYIDGYVLNFLKQIIENGRLVVIPDILEEFKRLKDEDERKLQANVKSVEKLSKVELEKIKKFLEDKYQCSVEILNTIDPDILGGVVIETPKEVIDASIRSRIDELAEVLKS